MADEELKVEVAGVKSEMKDLKLEVTGVKLEVAGVKGKIDEQSKKIDQFLEIMTNQSILAERLSQLDKRYTESCVNNKNNVDEIFNRLRQVEILISSSKTDKNDTGKTLQVIWDIIKIMIAILVALFVTGRIKVP